MLGRIMKRIVILVGFAFAFLLLGCISIHAEDMDTSSLSFNVTKVVEFSNMKYITVKVENNSDDTTYSFGWVNSCKFNVVTTDGTYSKVISNGTIKEDSSKEYSYMLNAPGKIKSVYYTDIRELDDNGLPISHSMGNYVSATVYCGIDSYKTVNGLAILIAAGAVLLAAVILIEVLKRKLGNGVVKGFGVILVIAGVITLVYSGYCFIVKPILGQADFWATAKKYWFLWLIGIILFALGRKLSGHKMSKEDFERSQRSYQQQQQFDEQTRLFNEQAERDRQAQQRQFDDFNNHNNGF